jgi:hypothetical protein
MSCSSSTTHTHCWPRHAAVWVRGSSKREGQRCRRPKQLASSCGVSTLPGYQVGIRLFSLSLSLCGQCVPPAPHCAPRVRSITSCSSTATVCALLPRRCTYVLCKLTSPTTLYVVPGYYSRICRVHVAARDTQCCPLPLSRHCAAVLRRVAARETHTVLPTHTLATVCSSTTSCIAAARHTHTAGHATRRCACVAAARERDKGVAAPSNSRRRAVLVLYPGTKLVYDCSLSLSLFLSLSLCGQCVPPAQHCAPRVRSI